MRSLYERSRRLHFLPFPATMPGMDTTPVSLLERGRDPSDQEAWARFVRLYTPLIYY